MRLKFFALAVSAALLSSCAYEGVVVEKELEPHPLYLSQGIEGKYTFILQDKAGVRHRQMVTPEVFERYAVGQYFNDLEMGPSGRMNDDSKVVHAPIMTASRSSERNAARLAAKPAIRKSIDVTTARKATRAKRIVAAKARARRHLAAATKRKISKPLKPAMTVAAVSPVVQPAPAIRQAETELGVVSISRCR
ncbi:MAG: hypothetical protein M3Y80_04120 [Verrucomicrobiota bacterium]|nr:hypothetical protein [Verrucomicrobiota bacterium]